MGLFWSTSTFNTGMPLGLGLSACSADRTPALSALSHQFALSGCRSSCLPNSFILFSSIKPPAYFVPFFPVVSYRVDLTPTSLLAPLSAPAGSSKLLHNEIDPVKDYLLSICLNANSRIVDFMDDRFQWRRNIATSSAGVSRKGDDESCRARGGGASEVGNPG